MTISPEQLAECRRLAEEVGRGMPSATLPSVTLQLLAELEAMREALGGLQAVVTGSWPCRPDLTLAALQVAAKTDQLDMATCFAKTAIDFLTGDYDPDNFDLGDDFALPSNPEGDGA